MIIGNMHGSTRKSLERNKKRVLDIVLKVSAYGNHNLYSLSAQKGLISKEWFDKNPMWREMNTYISLVSCYSHGRFDEPPKSWFTCDSYWDSICHNPRVGKAIVIGDEVFVV